MAQKNNIVSLKSALNNCRDEKEVIALKKDAQKLYPLGMKLLVERLAEVIVLDLIRNPILRSKKARKKYLSIVHNTLRQHFSGGKFLWQHAERLAYKYWVESENHEAKRKVKKVKNIWDVRMLIFYCPNSATEAEKIYREKLDSLWYFINN